jgi:hypothetical protein
MRRGSIIALACAAVLAMPGAANDHGDEGGGG